MNKKMNKAKWLLAGALGAVAGAAMARMPRVRKQVEDLLKKQDIV